MVRNIEKLSRAELGQIKNQLADNEAKSANET